MVCVQLSARPIAYPSTSRRMRRNVHTPRILLPLCDHSGPPPAPTLIVTRYMCIPAYEYTAPYYETKLQTAVYFLRDCQPHVLCTTAKQQRLLT